jgi:ABC-type amino acid transport substrate-binding protein
VDLANLLANAMNVELKLVEMPFGELLEALEAGKVDVVMSGMTMTPERNLKAAFVGPYIISGKSILTKDSTVAMAQEADDINQAAAKVDVNVDGSITAAAGAGKAKKSRRRQPKPAAAKKKRAARAPRGEKPSS